MSGKSKTRGRRASTPTSAGGGKAVLLYHVMLADDDFDTTARHLLGLVRDANKNFPGQPRVLLFDVDEHRNPVGGYDRDAEEAYWFILTFLSPYLTELPIIGGRARNPGPQRNDPPDLVVIIDNAAGGSPH
jgi:hypothetical protein